MTEVERLVAVEREAPEHLLRRLRVIDPTAELLYLGRGEWVLGVMTDDPRVRMAGKRLVQSCERVAAKLRAKDITHDHRRRWRMGLARQLGFRLTAEYEIRGEPTAAIVRDQEAMDFLHRTLTMQGVTDLNDLDDVRRKAEAHADLTDDHRARDAWRYMFTRQHAMKRIDLSTGPRSGFSRQPVAPTLS